MRFTSPDLARPVLTPMGRRLLQLSEHKLYSLDSAPIGSKDSGDVLLKSVLVKQTVKSAWHSVDQGYVGEMNDWHAGSAMGLDVIGEEGEEDEEEEDEEIPTRDERWFEELLSTLGEEDPQQFQPAEWMESSVSIPEYVDDLEYDEVESFTLSPTSAPTDLSSSTSSEIIVSPDSVTIALPEMEAVVAVHVEAVEVDADNEEEDEAELDTAFDNFVIPNNFNKPHHTSFTQTLYNYSSSRSFNNTSPPSLHSISPTSNTSSPEDSSSSPLGLGLSDDMIDNIDNIDLLPPPLLRSLSTSSNDSSSSCECLTPPQLSHHDDLYTEVDKLGGVLDELGLDLEKWLRGDRNEDTTNSLRLAFGDFIPGNS